MCASKPHFCTYFVAISKNYIPFSINLHYKEKTQKIEEISSKQMVKNWANEQKVGKGNSLFFLVLFLCHLVVVFLCMRDFLMYFNIIICGVPPPYAAIKVLEKYDS